MVQSFMRKPGTDPIRDRQPRADTAYFKMKIIIMTVFLGLLIYAMYRLNTVGLAPRAP